MSIRLTRFLEKRRLKRNTNLNSEKKRTTDCPALFENGVETAVSRKEHIIAVIFDLTKAYEITWKHGI